MSETITWQACPQRLKSPDEDKVLPFTEENVHQLLSGSRLLVARGILRHLSWAFTRGSGGVIDPDGERRVWKSAGEFAEEAMKAAQGILANYIPSKRTFDRALAGLVRLGILVRDWINLPQGRTSIPVYAYKPGRNWGAAVLGLNVSQGPDSLTQGLDNLTQGLDTAVAHTESSSELPSEKPSIPDPDRCAFPKPTEPLGTTEPTYLEDLPGNLKLRPRTVPVPLDDGMWNSPDEPVQAPSTLDSRPQPDPVQPEPDLVTDNSSEERALHELNSAKRRLWSWDGQMFRHPIRKSMTVEQAAADWTVDVVALKTVLLRQERALA